MPFLRERPTNLSNYRKTGKEESEHLGLATAQSISIDKLTIDIRVGRNIDNDIGLSRETNRVDNSD